MRNAKYSDIFKLVRRHIFENDVSFLGIGYAFMNIDVDKNLWRHFLELQDTRSHNNTRALRHSDGNLHRCVYIYV
jgi:hypothetical protein